jgi:hypothetical protein
LATQNTWMLGEERASVVHRISRCTEAGELDGESGSVLPKSEG